MKRSWIPLCALMVFAGCSSSPIAPNPTDPGGKGDIWGTDDRTETYESAPGTLARRLADASAALITRADLTEDGDEFQVNAQTLGARHNLCEGEVFTDQPAVAFCSATLVAPDLVVTSGHCIAQEFAQPSQARCDDVSVVFGFAYLEEDQGGAAPLERLPSTNVYHCERVEALGWYRSPTNADWALIRLDRPVEGRSPVPMLDGHPPVGAELLQIGHPSGIPQKLTPGTAAGEYPRLGADTFEYDSDIFGGNSGGGVFEVVSESIVGMPTAYNGQNYNWNAARSCSEATVCNDQVCRFPPGAYSTHAVLRELAASNPSLLAELTVVAGTVREPEPSADAGPLADAGVPDGGVFADGGVLDGGLSDAAVSDAGYHGAHVLVGYDFEGESASPSTQGPGISASDVGSADGVFQFSEGDGSGSAITDRGFGDDHYFEWSVSGGTSMRIEELFFAQRRSPTGPQDFELQVDTGDGFRTEASGELTSFFSTVGLRLMLPSTSSATFRLYGRGASSTSGTLRLDDLRVVGRVD